MTAQEQQLLAGLTSRVNQTQLPEKDAEAEQYLTEAFSRNPDAIYILAQTVLVQQYALDQARQQIEQAKQPQKHTSFLGNLLGMKDDPAPPPPPATAYAPVPNSSGYAAPQGYAPAAGYAQGSQGSGFLRSALQTATGVAAGALAFQGIESLLGGFGHHAGYGDSFGGFGGGRPEEIVNNYYGDGSRDDSSADLSGDAASRDFADSGTDDTSYTDDSGGSFDDSSSGDDSSLGNDDSF